MFLCLSSVHPQTSFTIITAQWPNVQVTTPSNTVSCVSTSTSRIPAEMTSIAAAHNVEAVVIGAGVIGLAVARALSIKGKEVLIVERASTIGSGKVPLGPSYGDEITTHVNGRLSLIPSHTLATHPLILPHFPFSS